ncbi:hypothetical protein [Nocardiopsis sp. FR26]|uniref:hypothetical protein n=1 Tax=Nocardiopsis sp. FR26 TaxID=2605987 RepID=UPI0013594340|nr:hypothetical protein [Nocardiopsis sp. FR26]
MPHSDPAPPDVRRTEPTGPAVIDTVQAITGGEAPYCRRCGEWTTVRPTVLAGLLNHILDHECDTTPTTEPRHTISGALASPFA